jgi:hypothetical protein
LFDYEINEEYSLIDDVWSEFEMEEIAKLSPWRKIF